MSERRALLDPKIYKISEEDSQDEEVLLALRGNESNNRWDIKPLAGIVRNSGLKGFSPQVTRLDARQGSKVKWPSHSPSDSETESSSSGETDESRESECWTCSSSKADDESEEESCSSWSSGSSSCSSCDSRNFGNSLDEGRKVRIGDHSNLLTFSNHFPRRNKNRTRDDSNYFLSQCEIEAGTDVDGNTRIIEFCSSCDEEAEASQRFHRPQIRPQFTSDPSPALSHRIPREVQSNRKEPTKGDGRIARFLKRGGSIPPPHGGRKSEREAEIGGGVRGSGEENSRSGRTTTGSTSSSWDMDSVFSSSRPHRQIRHVNLTVNNEISSGPKDYATAGRTRTTNSCLESLLGIVPENPIQIWASNESEPLPKGVYQVHQVSKKDPPNRNLASTIGRRHEKERIRIGGFISNGPAAKSRHLRLGDWIRTINGIVVNPVNVDFILSAIEQRHPVGPSSSKYQIKIGVTRCEYHARNEVKAEDQSLSRLAPELLQLPEQNLGTQRSREVEERLSRSSTMSPEMVTLNIRPEEPVSTFLFFVTNKSESETGQLGATITFVWPPKELRDDSTEEIYQGLTSTIPMAVTIYSILKGELGSSHARSLMELGGRTMDAEFWSDDGGSSLLLLMTKVNVSSASRTECNPVLPSPSAELIKSALAFKWGTLQRALTQENHEAVTKLLTRILRAPVTYRPSFLSHFPRSPINIVQHKLEEIQDQISLFDAGHWTRDKYHDCDENTEEGYCLGVSVFYKGKLLATTMEKELLHKSYCWILAELNWLGEKWRPVKKLLLCQRSALRDSSFTIIIGKEDILILVVVRCAEYPEHLLKKQVQEWTEKGRIILFRILLISRSKSRTTSPLSEDNSAAKAPHAKTAQSQSQRGNLIGNAWINLKNKVTRKSSLPTESHRKNGQVEPAYRNSSSKSSAKNSQNQWRNFREFGFSLPEEYKIIFLLKIDYARGVVKIHGAEETFLMETESFQKVQVVIPEILDRLNISNECGHFVNLPKKDKTLWIGGRGSRGKKLVVCLVGKDIVKNLDNILDKIEEGN